MPPALALSLASLFIAYLFARDYKQEPNVSSAVWIPTTWLLILGSRPISQWVGLTSSYTVDDILDGSPIDAAIYAALIFAAFVVLWKRQVPWGSVIGSNAWLFLFLLFGAVSIVWSDFPFVAFKRWIKGLGDPMMALVLLSDPAPGKATDRVFRRCALILLPLSVVFIKYYPELGRSYDRWIGTQFYTGVTTNKNTLGYLLFVFGLYFVSALLGRGARERYAGKRADLIIAIFFMFMIAWLFDKADSKTSLLALILSGVVVVGSRFNFVKAHLLGIILACAVPLMIFPSLTDGIIASAGRTANLTGRTDLWNSVLQLRVNDFFGAGFESFWLGDRMRRLWDMYDFRPNQAHNGYIEIFLNLGWIGLFFFVCAFCTAFRRVRKRLSADNSDAAADTNHLIFGTFGMGFFIAYALYNVTEAAFRPLNFSFMVFMLVIIEFPRGDVKSLRRLSSPTYPRCHGT